MERHISFDCGRRLAACRTDSASQTACHVLGHMRDRTAGRANEDAPRMLACATRSCFRDRLRVRFGRHAAAACPTPPHNFAYAPTTPAGRRPLSSANVRLPLWRVSGCGDAVAGSCFGTRAGAKPGGATRQHRATHDQQPGLAAIGLRRQPPGCAGQSARKAQVTAVSPRRQKHSTSSNPASRSAPSSASNGK
jgi:hypothetical protein